MRIAFFVHEFPKLSETFILQQVTGLIDRGHEIDIHAFRPGGVQRLPPDLEHYDLEAKTTYWGLATQPLARVADGIGALGAHLRSAPMAGLRGLNVLRHGRSAVNFRLLRASRLLLNRSAYDIVHGHFGPNGLLAANLQALGTLPSPIVTTFYGYDVTRTPLEQGRDAYARLFELGMPILALSEHMRQRLVDLGAAPSQVHVHHLGIDCERFSYVPRRNRGDGTMRVLSVGRFVEKKGFAHAVAAMTPFAEQGLDVQLTIVGHGPQFDEVQRLANEGPAADRIHLLGWKDNQEVARLMNEADVFLAPSVRSTCGDEEGTPTVILEAMARGLPVVSTIPSGIPEMIEDGVSGFLVPERDVGAIVERLSHLREHPEAWEEMGYAGRKIVEREFDRDTLNERLIEIYENSLVLN